MCDWLAEWNLEPDPEEVGRHDHGKEVCTYPHNDRRRRIDCALMQTK